MGNLQSNMIITMKAQGYSEKTIKLYTLSLRKLARHFHKSPLDLNSQQIVDFIYHLRVSQKSQATINVYFEAIKYFYRSHNLSDRIPRMRHKRARNRLPVILSQKQVIALLESCTSLKYKAIFSIIYSAGLRISEAINLEVRDVDFSRETILVRNGKYNKDRLTILAKKTSALLKDYMEIYRPGKYLFYHNDSQSTISTDCVQRRFRQLVMDNNLDRSIHVHTLRHCFATHLLESGTSVFYIMKLLGHSNIQTTMVYFHMASLEYLSIRSPIDCPRPAIADKKSSGGQYLFKEDPLVLAGWA